MLRRRSMLRYIGRAVGPGVTSESQSSCFVSVTTYLLCKCCKTLGMAQTMTCGPWSWCLIKTSHPCLWEGGPGGGGSIVPIPLVVALQRVGY